MTHSGIIYPIITGCAGVIAGLLLDGYRDEIRWVAGKISDWGNGIWKRILTF